MWGQYQGRASHVLDFPGERIGQGGHGWSHNVANAGPASHFPWWHHPHYGHLTGFPMYPAAPWRQHAARWAQYSAQCRNYNRPSPQFG